MNTKEIFTILLASIILALTVAFKDTSILLYSTISFLIILTTNVVVKKIAGYNFETVVRTKFWTWYQFGFRKDSHFKKPIPMLWLPLIITLFTKGIFFWFGILEFDVEAKAERSSKRHGLYRFSEVTEWHMAWIAIWGILANLLVAIAAYVAGFELFTKLSIYFIAWSTIPIGRLDGSKIFYSSRALWATIFTIAIITLAWSLTII
ncbi:MAG: hypothetical protein KJ592_02165 [Nanoarchaeota archaeon]|nr:hypothetical protein [Nanoarchaeota archaeon]